MGKAIADLMQLEKPSDHTNEVKWRDGLAVIKCCGPRTKSFGITAKMLERIDAVLVGCEGDSGNVEIFELAIDRFRDQMIDSRSSGAIGGKVKQVSRSVARRDGTLLCSLKAGDFLLLGSNLPLPKLKNVSF